MTPDQATNVTRNFIEWVFGFQLAPAIVQSLHDGAVTEMSKDPAGVQAVVKDMNATITIPFKDGATVEQMSVNIPQATVKNTYSLHLKCREKQGF